MNADTRLILGAALMLLGLLSPLGGMLVERTEWPAAVKTSVTAVLLFGMQITAVPAVAIMGKGAYDRVFNGVLAFLRPAGNVSRTRYQVGLVLFAGPMMFAWNASYIPSLMPADSGDRVWVSMGLDSITLVGLYVLGGDFWDKLQALFVWDARVAPERRTAGAAGGAGEPD